MMILSIYEANSEPKLQKLFEPALKIRSGQQKITREAL